MRALVLSGGGAKGAYQAGAIKRLLGDVGYHYDIVTGVSVGAINALYLAQFSAGNELDATHGLTDLWMSIDTERVYRKWYHGALWHLPAAWKPSVFDSSPLHAFVRSKVKLGAVQRSGKKISVGAVNRLTGEYANWTEMDNDLVDGVLASAAFPGFLTPVNVRGGWWRDGGTRRITPIKEAIVNGATVIDVICCSPDKVAPRRTKLPTTLDSIIESVDEALAEIDRRDVQETIKTNHCVEAGHPKYKNKKVVELNVLRPDDQLLRNSLDFDPVKIRLNFQAGYEQAKDIWK